MVAQRPEKWEGKEEEESPEDTATFEGHQHEVREERRRSEKSALEVTNYTLGLPPIQTTLGHAGVKGENLVQSRRVSIEETIVSELLSRSIKYEQPACYHR